LAANRASVALRSARTIGDEENDMATERRTDSARVNGENHGQGGTDPAAVARDVAGRASEVASDVAGEVANRIPAATASTREAINMAQMRMESSSDEMLMNGAMLSLGVALGLLLAGANRLLIALALIPAAAMGATLVDRRGRTS
jgi:hypothetical protein